MKTVSKKLLSLLLVAILLVSAIPFQAFATEPHDATHATVCKVKDGRTHEVFCDDPDCASCGQVVDTVGHNWDTVGNTCLDCGFVHQCAKTGKLDETGKCTICNYQCSAHLMVADPAGKPASVSTCFSAGYSGDFVCMTCGLKETGHDLPLAEHEYVGDYCKYCNAQKPGATDPTDPDGYHTVVFNANPGTVNGSTVHTVSVKDGDIITNIPQPTREGYDFEYWVSTADPTVKVYANPVGNVTYRASMGELFTAVWTLRAKQVDVYAVLNGDYSKPLSGYVWRGNVPENVNLLDYLKANAVSSVNVAVSNNPGYAWDGIFRDRLGNALADGTVNQAQNVYVNFTSIQYTLSFNPDGGSVTPTSKKVTVGNKVGTLPTPYKEGQVFMGWVDKTDGNKTYTEDTIYNYAGDKVLTAVWKSEAKVWLNVYVNGNFDKADRYIPIDSYVVGDHIYYTTIDALLRQYYAPASGSVLVVNGLFDKATWSSYRSDASQERKNDILISSNTDTEIYVMINGASTGITVLPTTPTTPNTTVPSNGFWVRDLNGNLVWYPAGSSLPSGTGYWVYDASGNPIIWVITGSSIIPTYIYIGSNPKTGDTAKIEIAAAVMVLAAAALITVMALRKKKSV